MAHMYIIIQVCHWWNCKYPVPVIYCTVACFCLHWHYCYQVCVGVHVFVGVCVEILFSRKNMLLVALWFSEEKPLMTTLLGPLIEELNLLFSQGNYCVHSAVYKHFVFVAYTCMMCILTQNYAPYKNSFGAM